MTLAVFGIGLVIFGALLVFVAIGGVFNATDRRPVRRGEHALALVMISGGSATMYGGFLHLQTARAEQWPRVPYAESSVDTAALERCIAQHDAVSSKCVCCAEGGYIFDSDNFVCIEVGSTQRHESTYEGAIYSCAEKTVMSFMTDDELEWWLSGEKMIREIYPSDGGVP